MAESYRRRMREVKQLRMLHCQFALLTATLSPRMEDVFEKALLLQRPLYVRSLTMRAELEYHVVKLPPSSSDAGTFEPSVAAHIRATPKQSWFTQEGDRTRVLVYVRSQADVLAPELGCSRHYSDSGTEEEKVAVLTRWFEGEFQVLVAMSALAGIDYPHVRLRDPLFSELRVM